MSNSNPISEIRRLNRYLDVVVPLITMIGAIGFSIAARSWSPLVGFAALLISCQIVAASISAVGNVLGRRIPWGPFTGAHVAIVVVAAAFFLMGIASLTERLIWFNAKTVPSFFVAKDYGDKYTANKERLFKLGCEARDAKGVIAKEEGSKVFVRCGEWYPQVYTISVSRVSYDKALAETFNDKPGAPVIIEPDEQ